MAAGSRAAASVPHTSGRLSRMRERKRAAPMVAAAKNAFRSAQGAGEEPTPGADRAFPSESPAEMPAKVAPRRPALVRSGADQVECHCPVDVGQVVHP